MRETYDVSVRIVSQKGKCTREHKIGQEWLVQKTTPEGICLSAFASMFPSIRMLMFGGVPPWSDEPVIKIACPDPDNPVVFELRRVEKQG